MISAISAKPHYLLFFLAAVFGLVAFGEKRDQSAKTLLLQSTTSTRDSGLYDYLLPKFTEVTNIKIRVVAVGTGLAIRNAKQCNGDLLLVHSKTDEEKFIAEGYGLARFDVMYNDFVIIGPKADPARIKGNLSVDIALAKIAAAKTGFASRGDDSGTHKAELRLWELAGIGKQARQNHWYFETGSGMGKTLNLAVGKGVYTLTDRSSWVKFGNKADFDILVEGQPPLFNQYGVSIVNPEKCPSVKKNEAETFITWLLSDKGQALINAYRVDGQQLFFGNASRQN